MGGTPSSPLDAGSGQRNGTYTSGSYGRRTQGISSPYGASGGSYRAEDPRFRRMQTPSATRQQQSQQQYQHQYPSSYQVAHAQTPTQRSSGMVHPPMPSAGAGAGVPRSSSGVSSFTRYNNSGDLAASSSFTGADYATGPAYGVGLPRAGSGQAPVPRREPVALPPLQASASFRARPNEPYLYSPFHGPPRPQPAPPAFAQTPGLMPGVVDQRALSGSSVGSSASAGGSEGGTRKLPPPLPPAAAVAAAAAAAKHQQYLQQQQQQQRQQQFQQHSPPPPVPQRRNSALGIGVGIGSSSGVGTSSSGTADVSGPADYLNSVYALPVPPAGAFYPPPLHQQDQHHQQQRQKPWPQHLPLPQPPQQPPQQPLQWQQQQQYSAQLQPPQWHVFGATTPRAAAGAGTPGPAAPSQFFAPAPGPGAPTSSPAPVLLRRDSWGTEERPLQFTAWQQQQDQADWRLQQQQQQQQYHQERSVRPSQQWVPEWPSFSSAPGAPAPIAPAVSLGPGASASASGGPRSGVSVGIGSGASVAASAGASADVSVPGSLSVDGYKGLSNAAGLHHCFLNVGLQLLWHLDEFRAPFFAMAEHHVCESQAAPGRQAAKSVVTGAGGAAPCVFCALQSLFANFAYADEPVLRVDAVRRALATIDPAGLFEWGQMGDADEALEDVLTRVHLYAVTAAAATGGARTPVFTGLVQTLAPDCGSNRNSNSNSNNIDHGGGAGLLETDEGARHRLQESRRHGTVRLADVLNLQYHSRPQSPVDTNAAGASGSFDGGPLDVQPLPYLDQLERRTSIFPATAVAVSTGPASSVTVTVVSPPLPTGPGALAPGAGGVLSGAGTGARAVAPPPGSLCSSSSCGGGGGSGSGVHGCPSHFVFGLRWRDYSVCAGLPAPCFAPAQALTPASGPGAGAGFGARVYAASLLSAARAVEAAAQAQAAVVAGIRDGLAAERELQQELAEHRRLVAGEAAAAAAARSDGAGLPMGVDSPGHGLAGRSVGHARAQSNSLSRQQQQQFRITAAGAAAPEAAAATAAAAAAEEQRLTAAVADVLGARAARVHAACLARGAFFAELLRRALVGQEAEPDTADAAAGESSAPNIRCPGAGAGGARGRACNAAGEVVRVVARPPPCLLLPVAWPYDLPSKETLEDFYALLPVWFDLGKAVVVPPPPAAPAAAVAVRVPGDTYLCDLEPHPPPALESALRPLLPAPADEATAAELAAAAATGAAPNVSPHSGPASPYAAHAAAAAASVDGGAGASNQSMVDFYQSFGLSDDGSIGQQQPPQWPQQRQGAGGLSEPCLPPAKTTRTASGARQQQQQQSPMLPPRAPAARARQPQGGSPFSSCAASPPGPAPAPASAPAPAPEPLAIASAFTPYALTALVCYFGRHYVAFVRDRAHGSLWIQLNDRAVRSVGSWQDLVSLCLRGRYQPTLLCFTRLPLEQLPPAQRPAGFNVPTPAPAPTPAPLPAAAASPAQQQKILHDDSFSHLWWSGGADEFLGHDRQ